MSRTQSFADIADSLKETERLDDVVLALSKKKKGRPLNERDHAAITFAIDFLEEVSSGTKWLSEDRPTIDARSRRAITSFFKAADSFGASRSQDRFVEDVNTLLNTARQVDSSDVDIKALDELRSFFSNLLGKSLQSIDQAFSANPFIPPSLA